MSRFSIKVTFLIVVLLVFGFIVLRNQGLGEVAYPEAVIKLEKENYSATEDVVLTVDFRNVEKKQSFIIHKAHAQSEEVIETEVRGPTGKAVPGIKTSVSETEADMYEVRVTPSSQMRPGKQTLRVTLKNGMALREVEQDFTWGVLAINTNKSIYLSGEVADLAIAVLRQPLL